MNTGSSTDINFMQLILLTILLFAAYLAALRKVMSMAKGEKFRLASVILLAMFICAGIMLVLSASIVGGLEVVLLGLMLLMAAGFLWWFCKTVAAEFSRVNKGALILFAGYVLVVLCGTIFFRQTGTDTTVQAEAFSAVKAALAGEGMGKLNHMILNVVLFIPYGVLFVLVHPQRFRSVLYSLMAGIMLSSIAEIMQLILQAGQCDLDDILANTFGTVLGYAACRIFLSRWKGDSYEGNDAD